MNKLKFVIPNLCTCFSMLLGLFSIYCAMHGRFELAAWLILWGVLLDKLDGTTARLFNASSEFGAQLDSFADFISFGVAPAALFTCSLAEMDMVHPGWVLSASGVYVVAVAARLARFNITTPPMADQLFYGIPTTVMGALLGSWYLTWLKFDLPSEFMSPMPFVLLGCSFAMISSIKLPKLKLRSNHFLNAFNFGNVLFAYIVAPLKLFPDILFLQGLGYVTVGVLWYAFFPPADKEKTINVLEEEEHEVPAIS